MSSERAGCTPAEGLARRVRRLAASAELIRRGERVLIGVSGGADSVALLHLLASWREPLGLLLHAVHVDHQLRSESSRDAQWVQQLAARLDIPFIIERRDVQALCRQGGWSLEDGARRARYHGFAAAALQTSAHVLALAHTADDQAETVLMRLLRGSGLTGLGGIPMTRSLGQVRLVRPLLSVWRREILAYLESHDLAYLEDASNQDLQFTRNRLRHQLLPMLERDYNPQIKAALVQLAEQCRDDQACLEQFAQRQWKRLAKVTSSGDVSVALAPLIRQAPSLQRQLVRRAIQQVRGDLVEFEFRHWREVEALMQGSNLDAVVHLPGGLCVSRTAERLLFHRSHDTSDLEDPTVSRRGAATARWRTPRLAPHRQTRYTGAS